MTGGTFNHMENEILFRGKCIDSGEWVYGYYVKHDAVKVCFSSDDPKTRHYIVRDGFCDWGFEPPLEYVEVDPETVCRSTGVKDKNGKLLFEHDIVKMRSYGGGYHEAVIYFAGGKFAVNGSNYYYKDIKSSSVEFVGSKFDSTK